MVGIRTALATLATILVSLQMDACPAFAASQNETTLYRFVGGSDGSEPLAGLIEDQSGNLFGTTDAGGGACRTKRGCGTVFMLTPAGTETVLYAFQGDKDGAGPKAPLIADQHGNLFGTTQEGGVGNCGTVFQVTQQGAHSVLYTFQGESDGCTPEGALLADQAGNLYGTAFFAGPGNCTEGCGTVFKLTPEGAYSVLYAFKGGSDGANPNGLAVDASGNFYGATAFGGSNLCGGVGCGAVYKLAADGTETVLYAFRGGRDGTVPQGGVILDASSNVYGTTLSGGGTGCDAYGCGIVFKIAPDGGETVLSRFNQANGPEQPYGVVMDAAGNLYGSTVDGGPAGCGTVYRVAPGGSARAIYSFTCGRDGGRPQAGLLLAPTGKELYGTASRNGMKYGTVFAVQIH